MAVNKDNNNNNNNNQKLRIVFMGTPVVAAQTLSAMIDANYKPVLVVSQPDRRQGRSMKLTASVVKELALEQEIPVFTPDRLNELSSIDKLREYQADIFIVIAYGQILSNEVLEIPRLGCYNLHYSLLPHLRGAAPIQFSLLNGDKKTGVSLIKMNEYMDQGAVVGQASYKIDEGINFFDLQQGLCPLGATLLIESLAKINQLKPVKQNHQHASYSRRVTKKDSQINWQRSAKEIYRQWQAFSPQPGIYTFYENKRIFFKQVKLVAGAYEEGKVDEVGKIVATNDGFKVICQKGFLEVLSCQWAGKRENNTLEFLRGLGEQRDKFFSGKFN
ncbi:MAG: methionyl-tRNA formyltransferase [SAR324 cluster bacterium]|nr:methionyl-tRNA formyltransferase [SAR324 cluster bacterium]